jgi:hypothetical protein
VNNAGVSQSDKLTLIIVCINQKDIDEKSHQVALMGEIYRRCSQVRIWLGCDSTTCGLEPPLRRIDSMFDDSIMQHNPFDLVCHLAENRHISEWSCFKAEESSNITFNNSVEFKSSWSGFLKVAESIWWKRMWTVQEAILPKAGVMTYDTRSVSLDTITKCGTNYYKHVWDCCEHVIPSLPQPLAIALDEFCTIFLTLDRDRDLPDDEYFDIQEQHLSYGPRQCQNPRDKVYGLLALIGNISDLDFWLTPDYSKSENEVFYDTTIAMLYRERKSLKCLTGAQYGAGKNKWASWVRNFGTPLPQLDADTGSNRLMIYDLFDASKGRKANFEIYRTWPQYADEEPYQVALKVTGRCVGKVTSVSAAVQSGGATEYAEQRKMVLIEWIKAAKVDLDLPGESQCYSDATKKWWRTILGGVMSMGNNSPEYSDWRKFENEAMAWIEPFFSWIHNNEIDMPFALDRTLIIAIDGRCYFQSKDGGQGLCYPTTRSADEIWVVDGSKVPFILRAVHLSSAASAELRPGEAYGVNDEGEYGVKDDFEPGEGFHGYYELVGDCYFDGFMYGEGVEHTEHDILLV